MASTIKTRRIAQTALEVSELGLGGATLASIFTEVPDAQARATVQAGIDAGITYFDTAPQYGFGRSEHLMGDVLRFQQDGLVVSTKVGRLLQPVRSEGERKYPHNWVKPLPFDMVYDYSYDAIMRSHEDSLQRLGMAKVDILYVHDIGVMTHGEEANRPLWRQLETGGYKALRELKDSRQISAIGLGVNEWEVLMDALDIGDWDVFLLAGRYTLLEQTSLDPLLSTCLKRNTSVVAAAPFNGGALMGTGKWNYDSAPAHIVEKVGKLERFCREHNVPIGAAALQFALTHPAVCSVLTGPKSPDELASTMAWWNTQIPAQFWSDLAAQGLVAEGTPLPASRAA